MRYYKNGWSPWLTIGYWKNNIFSNHMDQQVSAVGEIDVDYTVLNSYYTKWQFKVEMRRTKSSEPITFNYGNLVIL